MQSSVGGVAISTHRHLSKHWTEALGIYSRNGIRTNLHIIISDKASVDRFLDIYNFNNDVVEYFVLLPYTVAGRAKEKNLDFDYLFDKLTELGTSKIAFGANFYPYIKVIIELKAHNRPQL